MQKAKRGLLPLAGLAFALLAICTAIMCLHAGSAAAQQEQEADAKCEVINRYDENGTDIIDGVERLDFDLKDKVVQFF